MSKRHRYSDADFAAVKKMRAEGKMWREIAEAFGVSTGAIKKAVLLRDGPKREWVVDVSPRAINPWPPGVNFSPDELQVRA